jgi:hypothetical protein
MLFSLGGASPVFWVAAIFGTVYFLLRVVMMIFGGIGAEADTGSEAVGGGSMDGDAGHAAHATDAAFKLLSLNSITGFIARFGWAGLAAYVQHTLPFIASLAIATLAGVVVMLLTAFLFYLAMKLRSPGEVFSLPDAVGGNGEVYLDIPGGNGAGRVIFTVNGVKHEFDAISDSGSLIKSFERVTITRIVDMRTVAVAPLRSAG